LAAAIVEGAAGEGDAAVALDTAGAVVEWPGEVEEGFAVAALDEAATLVIQG